MSLDTAQPPVDRRQEQLEQWLADQLGAQLSGQSAGSDAGFRRYFRYQHNGRSLIAMDAPPDKEDCRPFIKVAAMLTRSGVHVPEILAQDLAQGFLLLSDLGLQTYLDVMNSPDFNLDQADAYFADATEALIKFQLSSQPDQLPPYDEALLRRELTLFPEWYLQRHLGLELDDTWSQLLEQLFDQLISQILPQQNVYVHRDYMPRNLMVNQGAGVGVLDFQDAVYGPISYDISCLFKDAFISWPEDKVTEWLQRYWLQAQQAGLSVPDSFADFQRHCDIMATQRHLKVIGIFARIAYRDGKLRYLTDVPRFFDYLKTVAQRRPELPALSELLALLESKTQELL